MNTMKKLLIGLCFSLLLSPAMAGDSSSGCGLGWAVFKKNSLISSALRATTNAMFLNTIAMTSGTSGCAKHSIVKNDKKSLHFMDANKHQLMTEMAYGQGEYVSGLAELMGCDTAVFSQKMKEGYSDVFAREDMKARELVNRVQAQILLNKDLAASCGLI